MNAADFEQKTGRKPVDDDLDRVNCGTPGVMGHLSCGWCEECDGPAFECLCSVQKFNERKGG